ncbi:MAG: hypothetical protein CME65_06395 [Halobacteriovoraceae bacterium]|nr:hypothetical protein [Halobacteriovoraceae bacterium]|tara:strand:+ start:13179 stop:18671 length:5493 start_codon:yes stop_codon:yes gene_type:complete
MKWGIFLIFIFLFVSCLPEQTVTSRNSEANSSTSTDTDSTLDDSNGSLNFGGNILWLNSGLTSSTLTIDFDNRKTIYLVGDQVHDYLTNSSNYSADYCVEIRFTATSSNTPKRLRAKAVPTFSNSISQGLITRFFRVNLASAVGNDFCDLPSEEKLNGSTVYIQSGDSNYDGIVDSADTAIVYRPSDVCSGCLNILASSDVVLYQNNENNSESDSSDDYLQRISLAQVDYSELIARLDFNGNSGSGSSSCSDLSCQGQGFDCCVQGQCVNEKSIKVSGVNADPTGFVEAEQEKFNDSNWYKRYPQFYYICLEQAPVDPPDDDEPEDPVGDADDRLSELTSDYNCLIELDSNSDSDPFHLDFVTSSPVCSTTCNGTDAISCTEDVMLRLFANCGCSETTLTNAINNCPAYTYDPVYQTDNSGQPTDTVVSYTCNTPEVAETPLPFSDLEVNVNSRSAPHRFFNEDGIEINPYESLESGVSTTQEGTEFLYLDEAYIFPRNGNFNMNSVLGQMNVQLTQARPALTIDLEYDKQYLITTRNGSYIQCPNCARDPWFSNFSAFPMSSSGVGVQAIGYTTRRDTFVTNTTLGNYEDTKFGRACYVPPTMLPFSHSESSDVQAQRLNRLETQAALYVNGYQKDWYGFNRGALIGSFDGVTWFAIGKGRRVRATSDKLYLAINAPFADLANPSEHLVAVQEYDFVSTAPLFDYLPEEEINSSNQNEAGSCQFWHQCETDSDCITKLGWEYSCADVSLQNTTWPEFEPLGASEIANSSQTGAISQFLQQGSLPPSSSSKRCVYRGAGSPCRVDYANIQDEAIRKLLTCAPNFYCESLASSNAFNKEVARFGKSLDELIENKNHYYGMDANILGRPKHYINEGNLTSLPSSVQTALENNFLETDSSGAGNFGLCRPGKLLPSYNGTTGTSDWRFSSQHAEADDEGRTDFISQIAGCNSALYTDLRYSSCPMLDEEGNYVQTQDAFIDDNFTLSDVGSGLTAAFVTERLSYSQNACGLESLSSEATVNTTTSSDDLAIFSAFRTIEADPLSSSGTILDQTLARDACFRKAGAVCHTDLDCSPNRLMSEVAQNFSDIDFFGNEAERIYYEEYLVCGQAQAPPTAGDSDYYDYEMSNNRCCRPLGESLTMFTEDSPNAEESIGLTSHIFGALNPTSPSRYSRYSSADATVNATTGESNLIRPSANTDDIDGNGTLDNTVNITNILQWTTIHSTASKTCCGGGWVREFDQGGNDWSQVNRLNISLSNFQCLNYRSELYRTEEAELLGLNQAILDKEKADYCGDPSVNSSSDTHEAGCIQHSISPITTIGAITKPSLNSSLTASGFITTDEDTMSGIWDSNLYTYSQLQDAMDGQFNPTLDWENNSVDEAEKKYFKIFMPSYITFDDIGSELTIQMTDPSNASGTANLTCSRLIPATTDCAGFVSGGSENAGMCFSHGAGVPDFGGGETINDGSCVGPNACCYTYDEDRRVLSASYSNDVYADSTLFENFDMHLSISGWAPIGTLAGEQWYINNATRFSSVPGVSDETALAGRRGSTPGNAMYYLSKLAKFEYLGIPQMTYEPLYCNDNYQKMVPGIFKEESDGAPLLTVIDFINHPRTFIDSNVDTPWSADGASGTTSNASSLNQNMATTQELVAKPSIFSDNQFKCCLELGSAIDADGDQSMCCSGFAAQDDDLANEAAVAGENVEGKIFCKLPVATDLHVYFNKFVSSEGLTDDLGTTPLVQDDFNAITGEPEQSQDVFGKLTAIGQRFCANNAVRRGAVIGNFPGQPTGTRNDVNAGATINSIADSNSDNGSANSTLQGAQLYSLGFKWNHHLYCDLGNN